MGGVAFYGATGGLSSALTDLGQSGVVYDISIGMLGPVGGVLAIVGIIACPITSGDTDFRSARLILAEITALPATSMSAVSLTDISMASEGFGLSAGIGYPAGIVFAAALFAVYLAMGKKLSADTRSRRDRRCRAVAQVFEIASLL